jgi:nucleoside-diphosphate-sugar epimerase
VSEPYFVTGALGCIGAWVARALVQRGDVPVAFDLGDDRRRLADVMEEDELARVRFVQGDVTDAAAVREALARSGARKVIHLAGLQVPACRADPVRGARVNVLGTMHVFESARELGVERVVYASSAAVYRIVPGAAPPTEADAAEPSTHYGIFKRANEGNARVAFEEHGLSSVGLRPLTVYGVGRDAGLTSGPTRAMKAAVAGRAFHVPFTGASDFHYVADTAAAFLACADRAPRGAHVFNLHGVTADVARVIELVEREEPRSRGTLTCGGPPLPIPPELDGSAIERAIPGLPRTSLEAGVHATLERFRALSRAGRLDTRDLDG